MHHVSSALEPSRHHFYLRLTIALTISAAVLTLTPQAALAGGQSPMGNVLCALIAIIYGNLGRGLAVLSVIVVGIGASLGKVSWGLALTVGAGISTIFGAIPLVAFLITGNSGAQICYGSNGIT